MPLTSLTVDGHVATLRIEPPEGLAGVAFDLALADAAAEVAADTAGIRALVVTGTESVFCAVEERLERLHITPHLICRIPE